MLAELRDLKSIPVHAASLPNQQGYGDRLFSQKAPSKRKLMQAGR